MKKNKNSDLPIDPSGGWYDRWQQADRAREQAEKVLQVVCLYHNIPLEFPLLDMDVTGLIQDLIDLR